MNPTEKKRRLAEALASGKIRGEESIACFLLTEELRHSVNESLTKNLSDTGELISAMEEKLENFLSAVREEVRDKDINLKAIIESLKGRDGVDGVDGKDAVVDYEKLANLVLPKIPKPKDGVSPVVDYRRIISDVLSQIPKPKDGISPIIDYTKIHNELLIEALPKIAQKVLETIVLPDVSGETIVKEINSLPTKPEFQIDASHIKNLPEITRNVIAGAAVGAIKGLRAGTGIVIDNTSQQYPTISTTSTGGSSTFLDLTDTPSSYLGQTLKGVRVNAGETGLEFYTTVDTDEKAKISANDTTAGYLNGKLVAGTGITLTENNDGGNETLTIASTVTETDTLATVTGRGASTSTQSTFSGGLITNEIKANSSAGVDIHSNAGTQVALFGAGGGSNSTFYGGVNFDTITIDRIAGFVGSKTLTSLDTATYPSLTELSYVKGVTSAIQTQLDAKLPSSSVSISANQIAYGSGANTITGSSTLTYDGSGTMQLSSDTTGLFTMKSAGSASGYPVIYGYASRGTVASPTIISNGDYLMTLRGFGYNGSSYTGGAYLTIRARGGTVSATSVPGQFLFYTTAVGSISPTLRGTIDNGGRWGLGNISDPITNTMVEIGQGYTYHLIMSQGSTNFRFAVGADTTTISLAGATTPLLSITTSTQITAAAAARKGLIVQGAASQTANLQEWQNSSGTALSVVDSAGNFGIGTSAPTNTLVVRATLPTIGTEATGFSHSFAATAYSRANQVGSFSTNSSTNGGAIFTGIGKSGATALLFIGATNETAPTIAPTVFASAKRSGTDTAAIASSEKAFSFYNGAAGWSIGTELLTVLGNGNVGVGTTAPSALIHGISTTEQLRLGYNASNHFSTTVGSNGSTTFALTGTSPTFTFSQGVTFSDGITIADAKNIILNTTTGTKIGTSTSQKLSLWNATPIVQPTTAITAATFVANTSGIVDDTATFDGYTIGQIVKALRNIGALA